MKMRRTLLTLLLLGFVASSLAEVPTPKSVWFAPGVASWKQKGTPENPFRVSSSADIQWKLDGLDRTHELRPIAHFLPGTYNAEDTVDVGTRIEIVGSGMGSTIFRKGENNKFPYSIFQNGNVGGGEEIEVRDLALDCNRRTRTGIILYGENNTVRNVHVYNHANYRDEKGNCLEAFAILLSNCVDPATGKWVNTSGGLVENCLVTNFYGYNGGGIGIAGGEDPSVATGTVRKCRVIGSRKPNVPSGKTDMRWGVAATVTEECITENLTVGTYIEGNAGPQTSIRNNRYINCAFAGVMISLRVTASAETIEVRNNDINLADGGYGIFAVNNFNLNGTLGNLIAENNRITRRRRTATADWCNIFNVPNFVLKNNTFDAAAVGRVRGSQGYIGENRALDGSHTTKKGLLRQPKESTSNQLQTLRRGSPQN